MEGENAPELFEPLLAEKIIAVVADDEKEERNEQGPLLDWLGKPISSSLLHDYGGWRAASFLLGSHCLQSVAISGCTVNLVIFLVRKMQQSNASAANVITNWIGTTFLTSILGGAVGDAYWGRLWTSIFCQVLLVMGLVMFSVMGTIITAETLPSSLHVILLYTALYTMGVGTASLAPNAVSLGADQFDSPKQTSSFISMSIAASSMGYMFSTSVISYIENEEQWRLGFLLSAGSGILSLLMLLAGTPTMRQHMPGENPFFSIAQVLCAAMRNHKWSKVVPAKSSAVNFCQRTTGIRCLDKAAPSKKHHECTVEQVKAVTSIVRLLPFWVCGILVASVVVQKGTLFVLQGDTMEKHVWGDIKFPPASMGLFSLAMVVVGAPVYTMLVEPYAKRHNREILSIGRMGAGLVVAIAMFSIAAIVEAHRLRIVHAAKADDGMAVPMSIFWLAPQYMLEGLTTVLYTCGHMEFNYMYAPQGMRSLATAMSLSGFALGNYLSSFLVTSFTFWIPKDLNEGHLDYFYWLLAALLLVDFLLFVVASKWVLSSSVEPCFQGRPESHVPNGVAEE
ncbi:hypothetical protein GOP47_0016663 [Adiantum capillus-veneris]|uniref:Uncharacterized protein n=1 Tax=Adiantum capillus-veneris TaxID=13818 RepID=A0A9D4ZAI4_ADICA|nr:hypothetical protein GOP47_0016663 [Adiantum capillus-veneris]